MFGTNDPADRYQAAAKQLTKAEAAHRANLDRLYAAPEARNAAQITPLRRDCERTERVLQDALKAAHEAHRAYWAQRRDELRDELKRIALVLAEYNALARLAGDTSPHPAQRHLQSLEIDGITAENYLADGVLGEDSGIPQEAPDSALLEDELGAWRPF
ncbi:MAG TPA: hypothetical protein PLF79_08680 [Thauera sp.]|uniref:hypothetical protein n=1 Tax=Thauera sp. TaxID=1905334 RepID=UPI002C4B2C25|nr:hypothetical protein [Thauera sp.]HRP23622.1 hypothetical protein [Thauera sp.]HRP66133.1 hypothetical protein [Thauera sp.]